ncbi:hypothetical protein SAMN05444365_101446 [Micromonospora pattaloongensis]|uniref:Uncharacterized protein n=1 Tax=Micromonospora pattaloongensis TaxID=405436 RepID=A0A1H3GKI1_9ACTN|nr:hypothetical protein [Micromonospora pattaloongensis]SDY03560.1 hypothetical protein SAMN05444365_101446 [Micromonospora pattaloongensis]
MTTANPAARAPAQMADANVGRRAAVAQADETKPALKTTEFYIFLIGVGAVLIASQLVGTAANGVDPFRADKAWWYITLLTIGYLGSRGLAKAGSYWRNNEGRE